MQPDKYQEMIPDEYQKKCLTTWYEPSHPLYLDPRHPLLGLAGEAGELLNLYKKYEYKPGYEFDRDKFLEELSDFWYYLRIIAYQQETILKPGQTWDDDILELLTSLASYSVGILDGWVNNKAIARNYLFTCYDILLALLYKLDCTLDYLTELNYRKLNSEPTAHGWKAA